MAVYVPCQRQRCTRFRFGCRTCLPTKLSIGLPLHFAVPQMPCELRIDSIHRAWPRSMSQILRLKLLSLKRQRRPSLCLRRFKASPNDQRRTYFLIPSPYQSYLYLQSLQSLQSTSPLQTPYSRSSIWPCWLLIARQLLQYKSLRTQRRHTPNKSYMSRKWLPSCKLSKNASRN